MLCLDLKEKKKKKKKIAFFIIILICKFVFMAKHHYRTNSQRLIDKFSVKRKRICVHLVVVKSVNDFLKETMINIISDHWRCLP